MFEGDRIHIGRQPDSDLRFDPESERVVSGRHAILLEEQGRWLIRDLGSTNGTHINGRAVVGDVEVRAGDRIELGNGGPLLEIQFGDAANAGAGTTVLRAHYARQNRRLKWIAGVSVAALAIATASLVASGRSSRHEREAWASERTSLLARMDTLLEQSDGAIASLRGELDGLAQVLRQSQAEVRTARGALERMPSQTGSDAEQLRRQLRSATEALARQQLAASLDFRAIERANRHAVALIYVESNDGSVSTATAFTVRSNGTLLTAAHVVRGPNADRQPRRIAVQFSDSKQFFPARVRGMAADADVAVLEVDNVLGEVPVITGFSAQQDSLRAGSPVAIIGYPLGGDVDLDDLEARGVARPLVTAAIVTNASRREIELQGYGAAGASGSPVFDGAGRVVGVLIGGRTNDGRQLLVAVPSAVAQSLLDRSR